MTTARATTVAGYQTTTVGSVVRGTLVATAAVGIVAVLLGALVAGSSAALGAFIATVMVCVFFAFGAVVLTVVASLAPAASLLVALLTYTLKVVLIGLVFLGLQRSGALQENVDASWLGGVVIACTLAWLGSQILFSVRARQPVYDLPSHGEEASDR
jgi:ATP synthase protein I